MTIRKLLDYRTYKDVSFQELERFKQNFRTSAFTCRIWSCRHATFGFNNLEDLIIHETDHQKQICSFQGCEYPIFSSAEALKTHVGKVHTQSNQVVPRKSIKKHTQTSTSLQQEKGRVRPLVSHRFPSGRIPRLPAPLFAAPHVPLTPAVSSLETNNS